MIDEQKNKKIEMKLLIAIIIIVVLAFGGYFGYKALNKSDAKKEEVPESKITPLLYEVTKEGSNNKMYLFGTIHAAKKEDLVFPKYVMDAYNNSHYLACEFDLVAYSENLEQAMEDAKKMLYQDGTTIKDHLREETYNNLITFLTNKKVYNNLYEMYQPIFFISLIANLQAQESGITSENGIDEYFLRLATKEKKNIIEVESYNSQMDMFLDFSDELNDLLIKETLDNYEEGIKNLKDLYNAWTEGDASKIYEYGMQEDLGLSDNYTEEQKKLVNQYDEKLVVERNNEMAKKAMEYFDNNQDVFFMVGALHIVGDTGLAKKLEQNGYTVQVVK